MSTAAVAIQNVEEITNPNAVKVVLNQQHEALYFSRAAVPYDRTQSAPTYYRHIGIYAYRVGFLKKYAQLATSPLEVAESLEQLRVLWHGFAIAVHVTEQPPEGGVDTPEDLERVRVAGRGRVDITVGSALDIFGGALPYADVVAWHRAQQQQQL